MLLIDSLLASPGKALFHLVAELGRQARDELLDDEPVKQQLQEAYAQLEAGAIDDREFDSLERRLVARLEQIQEMRAASY